MPILAPETQVKYAESVTVPHLVTDFGHGEMKHDNFDDSSSF